MYFVINTAKVVEVFCFIDDFCKEVAACFATHPLPADLLPRPTVGRRPSLSESEVLTILVLYHLSGFKCFEYFYQRLILGELHSYFPKAVSYTHFLSLARQACFHALLLAQYRCSLSARSGHYYIDSKKLPSVTTAEFTSTASLMAQRSEEKALVLWLKAAPGDK